MLGRDKRRPRKANRQGVSRSDSDPPIVFFRSANPTGRNAVPISDMPGIFGARSLHVVALLPGTSPHNPKWDATS